MGAGPDISSLNLEDILGDVFGSFFGGGMGGMGGMPGMGGRGRGRQRQGPQKGNNLQVQMTIPFDTACFGGTRKMRVTREESCQTCGGNGEKKGQASRASTPAPCARPAGARAPRPAPRRWR